MVTNRRPGVGHNSSKGMDTDSKPPGDGKVPPRAARAHRARLTGSPIGRLLADDSRAGFDGLPADQTGRRQNSVALVGIRPPLIQSKY